MVAREEVEKALNELRGPLRADGGDVELVDVQGDNVLVRLMGTCAGCPFSQQTVKNYIEAELKKKVPGVSEVVSVA
ncbi:MAG: NifU family protein [Candidatus Sifarchaeia archaeon]